MPDTPIMDTVYFYKFNNYYNRIIKRYDTIAEYGDPIATQTNCNFVHGDGVNASFTLNKGTALLDTPDYCVVLDYNSNISRWFVINSFKSRNGQDVLTLRRDLIADFYADVINYSPCLIRKGYVPNTNPLVFQDEGVQYNKIKKDEILIKDNSNCSYIVGFISKNAQAVAQVDGTVSSSNYDIHYDSLADFPLKDYVEGAGNNHTANAKHLIVDLCYAIRFCYVGSNYAGTNTAEMTMNYSGSSKPSGYNNTYANDININYYLSYKSNVTNSNFRTKNRNNNYDWVDEGIIKLYNSFLSKSYNLNDITIKNNALGLFSLEETTYQTLKSYNGMRIELNNVVYDVKLVSEDTLTETKVPTATIVNNINRLVTPSATDLTNIGKEVISNSYKTLSTSDITIIGRSAKYYLQFTKAEDTLKSEIKAPASRTHLEDSPYDMFMLINESGVTYGVNGVSYTSNHMVNMNMAQALGEASGTDALYDVQIVPFNPIPGSILADGTLDFTNYDVVEIKNSANTVVGHYVMCPKSSLKFTLEKDELKFNPTDYKKSHNLDLYRLCSPNQETVFDFSPSMNGGINTWEISFNYKPFASYIKVQPTWNWLLGPSTYNGLTDFRGLAYNSSLTVSQLNDAYASYVASNKNYQQLFDNQINTLTKTQDIQLGALEETLGLRSYTGMPISSILRTIGGSKDIDMQRELNNVALTKMRTDFNYQMDNIKSMPHTIKKLTSITEDTRIFPYIEYYTCSETEEQAFDNKIKYTGMTIMTTGNIYEYCKPNEETFIQASLIRLILLETEESANNQIAVEIASELDKGIYITKEE